MKKYFLSVPLFIAASLFIISCKKNGTGGEAVVTASVKHHDKNIYGATVYLKFNAKEMPSDPAVNYDLKLTADSAGEHVHFKGLLYGNYYLYGRGYDSSIAQTVSGGIPLKIKWSERKQEIEVTVPVTE